MGFKGMSKDCLGLRLRVSGLHQTWKWLHQTIAVHEYLISVISTDSTTESEQNHSKSECH